MAGKNHPGLPAAGHWTEGLETVGSCPACGANVYVRPAAGDAGADGLPKPLYLCDCRTRAESPAPPPAPKSPPAAPPALPVVLPPPPYVPVPMPTPAACDHCRCQPVYTPAGTRYACCKCGDGSQWATPSPHAPARWDVICQSGSVAPGQSRVTFDSTATGVAPGHTPEHA
jgi:hypothetical protein